MNTAILVPTIATLLVLLITGCTEPDGVPESNKSSLVTNAEQVSTESLLQQPVKVPYISTDQNVDQTEQTSQLDETVEIEVPTTDIANDESQAGSDTSATNTPVNDDELKQIGDITNCGDAFDGLSTTVIPPVVGSWTLEFSDEFLGNRVDGSKWKIGQHWAGINGIGGNQPENISQDCGYLTIVGDKRDANFSGKDYEYTTGELSTFKRFRQRYGYFEARIRYDAVQGFWPGFWLMSDRGLYGNTNKNRTSYLKFNLNSENRTKVDSAILELYVEAIDDGIQNLVIQRVEDDNWNENNITWNNRPIPDPVWIEQYFELDWSAGQTVRLDVTKEVNQTLAGDKVLSLALADTLMRSNRVSFASKESIHANRQPRLILAGSSEAIVVSEDASLGEGAEVADINFGSEQLLHVEEKWRITASTYDGGMEFDIMESLGHWGDHKTSHSLHWDGYGAAHKATGSGLLNIPPTDDGFHTYGLNWQPGHVEFYIDGSKTYEWTNERVGSVSGYIIMGLQMGGWADRLGDNRIVDESSLPGKMVVDYVRVWSDASN